MDKFIFFPSGRELEKTQTNFKNFTGIPGIVGALDCTHVIVPVGKEREFAFVDRKGHTSLNIQAVCDFDYKFIHVYAKWPGSSHDSFILQQSKLFHDFESGRRSGILLGDSGYGNGKNWLLTPFMTTENQKEKQYNYNQKKARVRIEQAFGQLKRRFRGLLVGLRVSPERELFPQLWPLSSFTILQRTEISLTLITKVRKMTLPCVWKT